MSTNELAKIEMENKSIVDYIQIYMKEKTWRVI